MPSPQTLAKLCHECQIKLPSTATRSSFLTDAGIHTANLSTRDATERCAAVAWARDSIAKSTDPATW